MSEQKQINGSVVKAIKGDLTALETECIVFYAQSDLKLGSGFGTAIAVRGGPSIQQECDGLAPVSDLGAVITKAGELKAAHIIHANGPKFQEAETEGKLKTTIVNALEIAKENSISRIALPPMGTGFYGIPLGDCARISMEAVKEHLEAGSTLQEVTFCLLDNRELAPFQLQIENLA